MTIGTPIHAIRRLEGIADFLDRSGRSSVHLCDALAKLDEARTVWREREPTDAEIGEMNFQPRRAIALAERATGIHVTNEAL